MKSLKTTCLLFASVLIFSTCSKQGPAGTNGTNGTNGVNGTNANTKALFFTAQPAQFLAGGNAYTYTYDDNAITDYALDGVFVAIQYMGSNYPLPCITPDINNSGEWECSYTDGQIQIIYVSSSPPTVPEEFSVVVILPPMIKRHPNTNWGNTAEVRALPEVQEALKNPGANK
jgi:hypothetical protein